MRLVVGKDYAGFVLKQKAIPALRAWWHEVEDVGSLGRRQSISRISRERSARR
jgi:hypothetical protein